MESNSSFMKAWMLMLVGCFILSGCVMVEEQCTKDNGLNEGSKCKRKHTSIVVTAPIDLHVKVQTYRRGHGHKN